MKEITKEEYKRSQYKMFLIVVSVVFFIILGYSIIWSIEYQMNYGYFKEITAEVIEFDKIDNQDYAVIEYTIDNTQYQKTTDYTDLKKGDKITIYYDEENPVGVIYNKDVRCVLLPVLSLVFGFVNLGLVVLYLTTYNKKTNKKKK